MYVCHYKLYLCCVLFYFFFFFKQKTAYEMRISDWSSDVCSSDLPVIENGFYYDFSYKRPFTPEDLAAIEKKMAELAKKDEPVTREEWRRDDAVKYFEGIGERYKAEIIASIPADQAMSLYREGDFMDLCRGPHVPSTRSEEHTSELQSLMRTSYAVFFLKKKK